MPLSRVSRTIPSSSNPPIVSSCPPTSEMKNQPSAAFFLALFAAIVTWSQPAAAQTEAQSSEALTAMRTVAGAELRVTRSPRTGLTTFIAPPSGGSIPVPDRSALTPSARALSFVATYGRAFGLRGEQDVLVSSSETDALGIDHVRLRQVRSGIPVTGGELVLHLRSDRVVAANGKTLDNLDGVNLDATVPSLDASTVAGRFVEERLQVSSPELSEPRLEIFNHGLLNGRDFPTRLAWFVEARSLALREYIWIDAHSQTVLLHFSQIADAKNRTVYNANNSSTLPGSLTRSEGGGITGDTDADKAYQYAGDTYDYYLANHGRDSFNSAGAEIRSTVHYCPPTGVGACPANYANAFWNGTQMVYGNGFAADDVVAHELTHAVTERTANLFYYMQSGALNESFSDIFGETVDLGNGAGNDASGVRWQVGEDLGIGAIRNMMDPTLKNDPGKMSDPQFRCDIDPVQEDAGGVHTNSGVPNHAYALMVDGGTYNSVTVSGIGLTKAGKIQYRALTQYLTSASDFLDNYNALQQACADLIGTAGITVNNCAEVKKALDAVQMPNVWPCTPPQAVPPALCSAGLQPLNLFFDNFESGLGNWSVSGNTGYWFRSSSPSNPLGGATYATSGVDSLWGYDRDTVGDARITLASNLPTVPAGARLQFNHSWGFDSGATTNYDGGLFEYSTNGGSTWNDAQPLIIGGATYNGTIASGFSNPLALRQAFVKDSFGYTASQLDLSGLAGLTAVKFRFRIGSDDSVGFDEYGWFIDDFRVYQCVPAISVNDVTLTEGDSGSQSAAFTVSLSAASTQPVTVLAATANNTAIAGADYTAVGPTLLTFAPGVTTQTFNVPVLGDLLNELDETFFVNLSGATNAIIARPQGVGTILNNDAGCTPGGTDTDGDGIPDTVEWTESRDPCVKDNDVFTSARLFAMQQYRDFLSREGDTFGIVYWTNNINTGMSRAEVTKAFFDSPEFQGAIAPVTRLYFAYFNRIPDKPGLDYWIGQYRAGLPLGSISQAFAASP